MRPVHGLGLLLALILVVTSRSWGDEVKPLTLTELRPRYIEAMGGMHRLQEMRSLVIRGTLTDAQGNRSDLQIWKARPDRARMVVENNEGARFTIGYDGEIAWQRIERADEQLTQRMPPEAARDFVRQAPIEGPLVRPDASSAKLEYRGLAETNGVETHVVALRFPDGVTTLCYIDAKTFVERLYRTETMVEGRKVVSESLPSDYRTVDGILFAFRTVERQPDGGRVTIEVESVEINPGLVDALFTMPPGD